MVATKRTSKSRTKTNSSISVAQKSEYGIPKGFWLYLALGILTLCGAYAIVSRLNGLGYLSSSGLLAWIVDPALLSFLVVIFGPLFIYRSAKGYKIPLLAKIAAYILISIAALALIVAIAASSQCTLDCSTSFLFSLSALYYSSLPIVMFLTATLMAGNVALLAVTGRSNQVAKK